MGDLGVDCGGHGHGLRAARSWASWRGRSARQALHGDTDPAGVALVAVGDSGEERGSDDRWGHGVSEREGEGWAASEWSGLSPGKFHFPNFSLIKLLPFDFFLHIILFGKILLVN